MGRGNEAFNAWSDAVSVDVNATRCCMPSTNRNTAPENPPSSRLAFDAMASNTGCTSDGELAMTFNISAVAACCSRASFSSLLGPETERRLTRVAAGAIRRLVLAVLRPFAGLALRAFASLVLPPVLDGRVIFAPRVKKSILSGPNPTLEGAERAQGRARDRPWCVGRAASTRSQLHTDCIHSRDRQQQHLRHARHHRDPIAAYQFGLNSQA